MNLAARPPSALAPEEFDQEHQDSAFTIVLQGRNVPIFSPRGVSVASLRAEADHFRVAQDAARVERALIARMAEDEALRPRGGSSWRSLRETLVRELASRPVEDGVSHPAELLVEKALGSSSGRSEIEALFRDPAFKNRPDLVRLIGRAPFDGSGWMLGMIEDALRASDLEIRDAAVHAVEDWDSPEGYRLLSSHSETVEWLSNYIRGVLKAR